MSPSTHTGQWLSGPPCPNHQLKQLIARATTQASAIRASFHHGSRSMDRHYTLPTAMRQPRRAA